MQSHIEAGLPAWVSIRQTADHLGLHDRTVRRYISRGLLKARRIGPRLIRVERESLLSLGRRIGGAA
jgi:excisionase family DNA binding protein